MTRVGRIYGEALYALAQDNQVSTAILAQMEVLDTCFRAEPDYLRLLSSPTVPKQERCRIIDNGFRGRIHIYLLNFLKILTENGYMRHYFNCHETYKNCFNRDNRILPVTVCTAVPMSNSQRDNLTDRLSRITGKQVKLLSRIDSNVLGGVRLDYDGKRLDDTVSHRLDAIRDMLHDIVL